MTNKIAIASEYFGSPDDRTDGSFVRIGCTSPSGCKVFLDCTDQAGMSHFGELDPIGGNGTAVASSDEFAEALGGGWATGRGSCSLVSNAGLEVQHMVRAGHTLVNSSVVVNKRIAAHPAFPSKALTCTVGVDLNGDGDTDDTVDGAAGGFSLRGWRRGSGLAGGAKSPTQNRQNANNPGPNGPTSHKHFIRLAQPNTIPNARLSVNMGLHSTPAPDQPTAVTDKGKAI